MIFTLIDNEDNDIIFSDEFDTVSRFLNSSRGKTHFVSSVMRKEIREAFKNGDESFNCMNTADTFEAFPATIEWEG